MVIYRNSNLENSIELDNHAPRNPYMDAEALGVLLCLLLMDDDWCYSISEIRELCDMSKNVEIKIRQKLIDTGYLYLGPSNQIMVDGKRKSAYTESMIYAHPALNPHDFYLKNKPGYLEGIHDAESRVRHIKGAPPTLLYYLRFDAKDVTVYKIGITEMGIKERYRNEPTPYTVIDVKSFPDRQDALNEESRILKAYSQYKYNGGVLERGGNSELFSKDVLGLDR